MTMPELLETGIKVIDLYAPIMRGGVTTMVAGGGMGKVVTTCELIRRVASRHGGCAVVVLLDDDLYPVDATVVEFKELGVDGVTTFVVARREEQAEGMQQAVVAGLTQAEGAMEAGREVLLVLDERLLDTSVVQRITMSQKGRGQAALTVLVWQYKVVTNATDRPVNPALAEQDGQLIFGYHLAMQRRWPAIHPVWSDSRLLQAEIVGVEHVRVAQAAKELIARHGNINGEDVAIDQQMQHRARLLLQFHTQPFVVAEPWDATPGEYVPVAETVQGVSRILAGDYDDLPEQALHFGGTLEQLVDKAQGNELP